MELTRPRLIAIGLTVIGFIIAGIAGVMLATQAASQGLGNTLGGALGAFALATPFLVGGIYLYARQSRDAVIEPESDMPQQRELMDFILANPQTTLVAAARNLNLTPDVVHSMVQELGALDIFTGYVTPTGELHQVQPLVMREVTQCQHCKAPLVGTESLIICTKCGTEYYRPREIGGKYRV